MLALRFRNRHGTRIQVQVAVAERFPGRDVGVAMKKNVPRLKRRSSPSSRNRTLAGSMLYSPFSDRLFPVLSEKFACFFLKTPYDSKKLHPFVLFLMQNLQVFNFVHKIQVLFLVQY